MNKASIWTGCRAATLAVAMVLGTAAGAQDPAAPGKPSANWARQQQSQAFATRKLAQSPRRHQWVAINMGDRTLRAFVTWPATKGKVPVVLVGHEVFGLTDSTRNTADQIAALGALTIAYDMLSGLGPNGGGTSSSENAGAFMTVLPNEMVDSVLNAWIDWGLRQPQANGKAAMVGLSWSGGAAFRYAASGRHHPALQWVAPMFDVGPPAFTQGPNKGNPNNPPVPVTTVDVPVYGFYGSTDTRVMNSLEATKAAMAAAGKPYEPVIYDGADHAYMRLGENPEDKNPANAVAVKATLERLGKLIAELR